MVPLAEALRLTSAAAERYRVPEDMAELAARNLIRIPHRSPSHTGMRALLEAVWLIADAHAGPHQDCEECDAIRRALVVALPVLRAEMDAGLRSRTDLDRGSEP